MPDFETAKLEQANPTLSNEYSLFTTYKIWTSQKYGFDLTKGFYTLKKIRIWMKLRTGLAPTICSVLPRETRASAEKTLLSLISVWDLSGQSDNMNNKASISCKISEAYSQNIFLLSKK